MHSITKVQRRKKVEKKEMRKKEKKKGEEKRKKKKKGERAQRRHKRRRCPCLFSFPPSHIASCMHACIGPGLAWHVAWHGHGHGMGMASSLVQSRRHLSFCLPSSRKLELRRRSRPCRAHVARFPGFPPGCDCCLATMTARLPQLSKHPSSIC